MGTTASLQSRFLKGDPKLEAAAKSNPAHILKGAAGEHVSRIQHAVMVLDGVVIDAAEVKSKTYGPSTAQAVLAYKQKRKIINASYQKQADDIVGIMTLAQMDKELLALEKTIVTEMVQCDFGGKRGGSAPA